MAHFTGKINNYFAHCADLSDLKREYHRLVMIHHPDVGGDTATMQAINAEYEIRFEALKSEHNAANDADHQTTEMPNEFIEIITALLHLSGLRDAARYLSKCLYDANEAVRAAKEGLNTDLASYEASLEDNTNAFLDIQENVEVISNALLQNRLNREKIAQANRRIAKILSSQI